jgi:pentatricopeptide repeat protein
MYIQMAFEVLRVMTAAQLQPDELTFRSLAEACAVCGDGHCALDLLDNMRHWGFLPDPDITSSVVQAMLHSMASGGEYVDDEFDPLGVAAAVVGRLSVGQTPGPANATPRYRIVTAKDVLDAVTSNRVFTLRERLGPRDDDDVHTEASRQLQQQPHSEPKRRVPFASSSSSSSSYPQETSSGSPAAARSAAAVVAAVEAPAVSGGGSSPSVAAGRPRNRSSSGGAKPDASGGMDITKSISAHGSNSRPAASEMPAPSSELSPSSVPARSPVAAASARKSAPAKPASGSSYNTRKSRLLFLRQPAAPASPRLGTQVLLADRILDMQFPELEINLNDPFGTFCPNIKCGKSQTLQEIREGWVGVDPNKYTTRCSYCGKEFVPRFTVHSISPVWMKEESDADTKDSSAPCSDVLLWCELLSPWVLRKEVLLILLNDGIDAFLSKDFRRPAPSNTQNAVIFWNLIVSFRLYGLPYSFMIADTLSTAFLVPLIDMSGDS